ncbi:MAG: 5-(carboxyamino)imidazole ribonucleotide synthase [Flavobacteriales bacterium]|nr:5-(carboxyamino)imidazole ribonucleotide synthase [Flavobacteriales bacterium]
MSTNRTIALLGGGQLGRMFIENALRYPVRVDALDPDKSAPCADLATRFNTGDLYDEAAILCHAADADVVGIEIEHVSVAALERLQAQGKRVIPSPGVLRTIQDKGLQKQFYMDHGIPTAPFVLVDTREELHHHADLLPGFLKLRTGGYDGKGVMPIRSVEDIAGAFDGPCVLERHTDVAMELAVIVVRDEAGHQVTYDPVEMVFDPRYNLVDHLRAPARIPDRTANASRELAARVAEAFDAPGIYAVELFLTTTGELLVNETAPRAHNSGHHTIEACNSSQFDQLLRVYMGWPLGDTSLRSHAAMINLVGEDGRGTPQLDGADTVLALPAAYPHLYGKKETRTGRKMGHVTVLAPSHDELDKAIGTVKAHCRVVPARPLTIE